MLKYIIRTGMRYGSWLSNRGISNPPLYPYKLYYISPEEITMYPENKPSIPVYAASGVKGGDWDTVLKDFHSGIVYTSFKNHFIKDKKWKETQYYGMLIDSLKNSKNYKNIRNRQDIENRLKNLDDLFEKIKSDGYMSQREILKTKSEVITRKDYLPIEMGEITVDITRNGQFVWYGGAHRLSIAKILDVDPIPVRIRVRHSLWQKKRQKIANTNSDPEHPDLKSLQ